MFIVLRTIIQSDKQTEQVLGPFNDLDSAAHAERPTISGQYAVTDNIYKLNWVNALTWMHHDDTVATKSDNL